MKEALIELMQKILKEEENRRVPEKKNLLDFCHQLASYLDTASTQLGAAKVPAIGAKILYEEIDKIVVSSGLTQQPLDLLLFTAKFGLSPQFKKILETKKDFLSQKIADKTWRYLLLDWILCHGEKVSDFFEVICQRTELSITSDIICYAFEKCKKDEKTIYIFLSHIDDQTIEELRINHQIIVDRQCSKAISAHFATRETLDQHLQMLSKPSTWGDNLGPVICFLTFFLTNFRENKLYFKFFVEQEFKKRLNVTEEVTEKNKIYFYIHNILKGIIIDNSDVDKKNNYSAESVVQKSVMISETESNQFFNIEKKDKEVKKDKKKTDRRSSVIFGSSLFNKKSSVESRPVVFVVPQDPLSSNIRAYYKLMKEALEQGGNVDVNKKKHLREIVKNLKESHVLMEERSETGLFSFLYDFSKAQGEMDKNTLRGKKKENLTHTLFSLAIHFQHIPVIEDIFACEKFPLPFIVSLLEELTEGNVAYCEWFNSFSDEKLENNLTAVKIFLIALKMIRAESGLIAFPEKQMSMQVVAYSLSLLEAGKEKFFSTLVQAKKENQSCDELKSEFLKVLKSAKILCEHFLVEQKDLKNRFYSLLVHCVILSYQHASYRLAAKIVDIFGVLEAQSLNTLFEAVKKIQETGSLFSDKRSSIRQQNDEEQNFFNYLTVRKVISVEMQGEFSWRFFIFYLMRLLLIQPSYILSFVEDTRSQIVHLQGLENKVHLFVDNLLSLCERMEANKIASSLEQLNEIFPLPKKEINQSEANYGALPLSGAATTQEGSGANRVEYGLFPPVPKAEAVYGKILDKEKYRKNKMKVEGKENLVDLIEETVATMEKESSVSPINQ